jgi:4-diphosphocytidyl-2-C-methyl-D-erythritol kinase
VPAYPQDETLTTVECIAPAKINLALHITGQRPDGYHEIDTIVGFGRPYDRLMMSLAKNGLLASSGRVKLDLTGPFADVLRNNADNLVENAVNQLARIVNDPELPGVEILLEKHIPVEAGLGGGSADAAATLIGLQQLWKLPEGNDQLDIAAVQLGSDVPMCLQCTALRARGIGESITPVAMPGKLAAVLVNPGRQVSTPIVFTALENKTNNSIGAIDSNTAISIEMLRDFRNDLEAPAIAIEPIIAMVLDYLALLPGCKLARMSGSGASCFALFNSFHEARTAHKRVLSDYPQWWSMPSEIGSFSLQERISVTDGRAAP